MKSLACSFFGHRNIEITNLLKKKIKYCLEDLIINKNVQIFLFGSKSSFNDICHLVVSELKEKYPIIKRICYTCKSETCTLESEREEREKSYSLLLNREIHLLGFEEEVEHKKKYDAGRASYVERNEAMIEDCDYCVFYYNKDYVLPKKTNSGTKIAYEYAIRKKKNIINLF